MRRGWFLLAPALILAGCASEPPEPEPAPEPVATAPAPKPKNDPLKYLKGRTLKPQPTRPLNVRSQCSHRDAIGTQTRLDLMVKEAEVKRLNATVAIKGHGTCRFNLADFKQAETLPQPLLRHKNAPDCQLRLWEEGPRVTLAFNNCPKACEGDAFSYLWPIMIDGKSGRCH